MQYLWSCCCRHTTTVCVPVSRSQDSPIATPSRRFNLVDMQFIRKEVEKLLAQGVIEPSRSPWRSRVLVTKDERHKRHMVIDYSQTINRFTALDAYPLPRIDQQVNELAKCKWFSTLDLKFAYYQVPLATEDRAIYRLRN